MSRSSQLFPSAEITRLAAGDQWRRLPDSSGGETKVRVSKPGRWGDAPGEADLLAPDTAKEPSCRYVLERA